MPLYTLISLLGTLMQWGRQEIEIVTAGKGLVRCGGWLHRSVGCSNVLSRSGLQKLCVHVYEESILLRSMNGSSLYYFLISLKNSKL